MEENRRGNLSHENLFAMVVNSQVIFDEIVPKQRRDHHTRQRLLERITKNLSLEKAVHLQHHKMDLKIVNGW